MLVEITGVEIAEKEVIILANSVEDMFLFDNLYEDFEAEQVKFLFTEPSGLKYLYKIVSSQPKCKSQKSLGKKIEALTSVITQINDSFLVRD